VANDLTDNSYHVMITTDLTSITIIDGFTITDGHATGSNTTTTYNGENFNRTHGGGVYNRSSSPTIKNCNISDNSATFGGGVMNISSSPIITNCTFYSDTASTGGGAMYNNSTSDPIVKQSIRAYLVTIMLLTMEERFTLLQMQRSQSLIALLVRITQMIKVEPYTAMTQKSN